MDQRQADILTAIITEFVTTAQPVASSTISDKYDFGVSPATIRNDMAALEADGYITHPHTSAGRVPTEQGYNFYITERLEAVTPTSQAKQRLQKAADGTDDGQRIRQLAKELAELSQQSVFIGFGPLDVYYTGIANLFAQPEFAQQAMVTTVSQVVDQLDQVIAKTFRSVTEQPEIRIGSANPFGSACGTVLTKIAHGDQSSILGVLGPMRMDYGRVVGLVTYTKELIMHN